MAHQHKYDKSGRQLCCTQQEKIYAKAGVKHLLHEGHTHDDGHANHDEEGDGHKIVANFEDLIQFAMGMEQLTIQEKMP